MKELIKQLLEREKTLKTKLEELQNKKESIEVDVSGWEYEQETLEECSYKLNDVLSDLDYLDYYFDTSSLNIMLDDIEEKVSDIQDSIEELNEELENIEELIEEVSHDLKEVNETILLLKNTLINSYRLGLVIDIDEEDLIELDLYEDFCKIDRGEL